MQEDSPDFSQFQDDFDRAPAQREAHGDSDYPAIADGKYTARVNRVELKKTSTGKWHLNWGLKITSVEYADLYLWRKNFLSTSQNIEFLKQDLCLCGLQLRSLNELKDPDVLHKLVGVHLGVAKKTQGGYENVYLNERLDDKLVSAPKSRQDAPPDPVWNSNTDDDVPF